MTANDVLTQPQVSDGTGPRPTSGSYRLFAVAVVATYLCLGLVAYGPSLPEIDQRVFGSLGDYNLFIWFLGWAPHAVLHGLNPFFSNSMFAPAGVNLAQNTEGPLLGWVLAPVTLTYGPIAAANLLMVVAMPISASAAFFVCWKWQIWGPAAAVGGLIYGFSPYMVGQALGHPVLIFVPLPPLIVWTLVSILQGKGPDRRLGLQLGLLLAAQYLISPEIFSSMLVIVGVGLGLVALRFPHRAIRMGRTAIPPIAIGAGVCLVLLAYPIWMLTAGPEHVSGATYVLNNPYHSDLLSFIIPSPMQTVSLGLNRNDAGLLAFGSPIEAGGYIGIPVLIVAGVLTWRSRRSARMQLALALFLSCAILSLGPFLYIKGHSTHIPLPFWIMGHVPLLSNLLPVRFTYEMSACLAAIFAFALDDVHRSFRSNRMTSIKGTTLPVVASVVVGLVVVVLIASQLPRWPYAYSQAPKLPASLSRIIPKGAPVAITYPHAYGSQSTLPLLWQAEAGYSFRILGGYAFHPNLQDKGSDIPNPLEPNDLQNFLVLSEFLDSPTERYLLGSHGSLPPPPITPSLIAATRATLSRYDVRLIVVDRSYPHSKGVMKLFRRTLGPPTLSEGQFSLWKVGRTSSQ
jgi:hypothetical protein